MKNIIRPVTRTKEEARASYNRMSSFYDWMAGSSEKKYRDLGLKLLNAKPGERILEIGYGTGHCLVALAESVGENGQVTGIDISDGMQSIALERLQKADLAERVHLDVGDAAQLPYEEASFDGIFMSFTLELFDTPEIVAVLRSCLAKLNTNGRLCVVTMVRPPQPGLAVRMYEWFHDRMPVAVDCRPIHAQSSLHEAGYQIESVFEENMWGLPVEIIIARRG